MNEPELNGSEEKKRKKLSNNPIKMQLFIILFLFFQFHPYSSRSIKVVFLHIQNFVMVSSTEIKLRFALSSTKHSTMREIIIAIIEIIKTGCEYESTVKHIIKQRLHDSCTQSRFYSSEQEKNERTEKNF